MILHVSKPIIWGSSRGWGFRFNWLEEIELSGDEQNAQKNYGEFVQDTTATIEAARKAIEEKTAQTAEAETALSETEEAQTYVFV